MAERTAIIIGAGPAGLTAAHELATRAGIRPIVLERSEYMGGISRTIRYKGNRMDIGGHRFFSKSDRVMNWWLAQMPMEEGDEAERIDLRMLTRSRKSRIYFLRQFFNYPIQLTTDTLRKLGAARTVRIGCSYVYRTMFPIKPVKNLEEFFINRFGRELYLTFFKEYTEKVWGVPCDKISAEWGAQRIKGLSIRKALTHFVKQAVGSGKSEIAQKETETSLIERFLYPKFGPGQMWEEVARKVLAAGGEIITGIEVDKVETRYGRVVAVTGRMAGKNSEIVNNEIRRFAGDYFFSTTSVQELARAMGEAIPAPVREIAEGLQYRDFITVGLLLKKLRIHEPEDLTNKLISDNWIYIQEPDVLIGRLQVFNNWSPYLVGDRRNVWLGAEYFCQEGDDLWRRTDEDMARLAAEELDKIGIIDKNDLLDATVARMPKTYPAYFGLYERFDEVRKCMDGFENLFLVGRNGMHKYNNQDHSMLTAMTAVDNIVAGVTGKNNIWAVNTEEEYHEAKSAAQAAKAKA